MRSSQRAGEMRGRSELEERDSPREIALLWFGALAGPVAWVVGLNLQYSLVRIACTEGSMLPLHAAGLAALGLALAGGWVAWSQRRGMGGGGPPGGAAEVSRRRFMAVTGIMSAALFSLAILAQWAGTLFLHPCMGV